MCLYFPTTRLVGVGAGVVSKEEFSPFSIHIWNGSLCYVYMVLFSGAGRRCRCAGNNAGAP